MTNTEKDEPSTGVDSPATESTSGKSTAAADAVERYLAGARAGEYAALFARCDAVLALTPELSKSPEVAWAFEEARELARRDPRGREGANGTTRWPESWWQNPGIAWSAASVLAVALVVAVQPRPPTSSDTADLATADGPTVASGPGEAVDAGTVAGSLPANPGAERPTVQNITFVPIVISTELAQTLAEVRPVVLLADHTPVDSRSLAMMPFTASAGSGNPGGSTISASSIYTQVYRQLAAIPGLYLIDPGTAAVYAGSELSPSEIAQQLGVRGILEGNIDSINGDIRFSLSFTDAALAGSSINQSLERPAAEAAFLQSDIASRVVDALARTPPPEPLEQIL
jgi:TolB-like protein